MNEPQTANPPMKTFLVSVFLEIADPGEHWWSQSKTFSSGNHGLVHAQTKEIAKAMLAFDVKEQARLRNPDRCTITYDNIIATDFDFFKKQGF